MMSTKRFSPINLVSRRAFVAMAATLLGAAVAAPAGAYNAAGTVSGTVRSADGAPIRGARISAEGGLARREGLTDAAGRYTLSRLPADAYTVRAERAGFRVAALRADVGESATVSLDFTLTAGGAPEGGSPSR